MSDMSNFDRGNEGGFKPAEPGNARADLKEKARMVGNDLKNKAGELGDNLSQAAKEKAANLGQAAQDFAAGAGEKFSEAANQQKKYGADYLSNLAQVTHRAANEFDREIPFAGRYIHQAADQVETFSDALRERDMGELMQEVQSFARRQPALFFGGAMMLGFAAFRVLRNAAPSGPSNWPTAGRRQ